MESAHTESNRLRSECDEVVDGKLSEFETTLNGLLRTVNSDRSALRGGAGVRSRGGDYSAPGRAGGAASNTRYAEGETYERRYNER